MHDCGINSFMLVYTHTHTRTYSHTCTHTHTTHTHTHTTHTPHAHMRTHHTHTHTPHTHTHTHTPSQLQWGSPFLSPTHWLVQGKCSGKVCIQIKNKGKRRESTCTCTYNYHTACGFVSVLHIPGACARLMRPLFIREEKGGGHVNVSDYTREYFVVYSWVFHTYGMNTLLCVTRFSGNGLVMVCAWLNTTNGICVHCIMEFEDRHVLKICFSLPLPSPPPPRRKFMPTLVKALPCWVQPWHWTLWWKYYSSA